MPHIIDQYGATNPGKQSTDAITAFEAWYVQRRGQKYRPHRLDDADIRSYLLHLKLNDASTKRIKDTIQSLKAFYAWNVSEGHVDKSPFEQFDFGRPLLSTEQIRRRSSKLEGDPLKRELSRLRALNELAEELNKTADMGTLLDRVLITLARVMHLKTAWAFLKTDSGLEAYAEWADAPHDFALAGSCGLPEGLKVENCKYLRTPGDCRCQVLLRDGRLVRAVNIVECSRLEDASKDQENLDDLFYHATVPLLSVDRSLGLINVATDRWELFTAADLQFLSAAGALVASALERAHMHDVAQGKKSLLEEELAMARAVQHSLLPTTMPEVQGFEIAADWNAALEMAGDFYDMFQLHDNRWALVIADVSGKGAPAALYMAMARSLIRLEAERNLSPAATLTEVNRRLVAESSAGMFVTVFYLLLDPATGEMTYCNAGHDPPLVRSSQADLQPLPYGGHFLGILPEVELNDESLILGPGETLITYTDGLVDAVNGEEEFYGVERLCRSIESAPADAGSMLPCLLSDLSSFCGDTSRPDDITLLLVTRSA